MCAISRNKRACKANLRMDEIVWYHPLFDKELQRFLKCTTCWESSYIVNSC